MQAQVRSQAPLSAGAGLSTVLTAAARWCFAQLLLCAVSFRSQNSHIGWPSCDAKVNCRADAIRAL